MKDLTFHAVISFSKIEIISYGINDFLKCASDQLLHKMKDDLIEKISQDLKDEDNVYRFSVSVKKIENIKDE